jgi:hypothetical protein
MLYTKFVRTNRSNTHEYAREAKARGTAARSHTDAHETRTRIPRVYARLRTNRHGTHSRSTRSQSQVTGRGPRSRSSTRTRIARTRTRIVRDGIANRIHADTNGRAPARVQVGVTQIRIRIARAQEHVQRHSRQPQPQVAGRLSRSVISSAARSRRAQERGRGRHAAQVTGHSAENTTRHRATLRHSTTARYDTIRHDTRETGSRSRIRYACERITNRYNTRGTHGTAPQHSTAHRSARNTARHAYAQQIAKPFRNPTGKGKTFREHVKKDRGVG